MKVEAQLEKLGLKLPPATGPGANYVPWVREGNLIFVSGQIPQDEQGIRYKGRVGEEVSIEDGYASARLCALNCIAWLKHAVGDLDLVQQIVRVGGFVNCAASFGQHPQVINGASDLIVELFGESGRHARAAVGTSSLPLNVSTEVELIAVVK